MAKQRLEYLDILKFFGIMLIYSAHFGEVIGLFFPFAHEFEVPLFFFVAGCLENLNKEKSILKNIKKRFINIMVPFYIFAIASIILKVFLTNDNLSTVADYLISIAKGCERNTFFAYSLWFLPSMFVINVLFEFMKKLRFPVLIFICSLLLYMGRTSYIAKVFYLPYFSIHAVFLYQIYFVLGYLLFSKMHIILSSEKTIHKVIKYVTGIYACAYTALLYFKHNIYSLNVSEPSWFATGLKWFVPVITALTAIWFCFIAAYALRNVKLLSDLGKNTLYNCGNEWMIKSVIGWTVKVFVSFNITNPFLAMLYSFSLLLLQHKYVVPIESKYMKIIKDKLMLIKLPSKKTSLPTETPVQDGVQQA